MRKLLQLTIGATALFVVVLVGVVLFTVTRPNDPPQPAAAITLDMIVKGFEQGPIHASGEISIEATRCNLTESDLVVDTLATYERVNQATEKVTLVAADNTTMEPGCESSNSRWSLPARVVPGVWRVNVEYTEGGQEIATATSNDFVVEP